MGDIYHSCRRVVVYLGPEIRDSAKMFEIMRSYWRNGMKWGVVGERHLTPAETSQYLGIDVPVETGGVDRPSDEDNIWKSVEELFLRPWFRRVWVVQEFILGRDVVMLLGRMECHWRHVWAACFQYGDDVVPFLSPTAFPGVRAMNAMGNERRARERNPSKYMHIFSSIIDFGSSESTLPQDLFYGFLGLGPDSANPEFYPDYSTSFDLINQRVTKELLFGEEGMEVLMEAGMRTNQSNLPSWIPDYRRLGSIGKTLGSRPYLASRQASFYVRTRPKEEDVIVVRGRGFDNIERVTRDGDNSDWYTLESEDIMPFLANCIKTFLTDNASSPTGEHLIDACWRTIIADRGMDSLRASEEMALGFYGFHMYLLKHANGRPGFARWEDLLNLLSQKFSTRTTWPHTFRLLKDFRKCAKMTGQKYELLLSRTHRGYISLVPKSCEPGDQVWVIASCTAPLILRECLGRPGKYRLVGTSYVHGIMDGEAFDEENLQEVSIY